MITHSDMGARGEKLWDEVTELTELDPTQLVILEEACRSADRLDQLNDIIAGRGVINLLHARHMIPGNDSVITMTVDGVMSEARQQQTVFKQLLAALRLPDLASGKKPQRRGGARGAYAPSGARGVSSLDRARAAKSS